MGIFWITNRYYGPRFTRYRPYNQKIILSCYSNSIHTKDPDFPVLIVGAGPVGLVLSILLSKFVAGLMAFIRCKMCNSGEKQVFLKTSSSSFHQQSINGVNYLHQVFRKLNGLADVIQRFQPPIDLWRKFIYCTSLSGQILGSVDHLQPQDIDGFVSPVSVAHFSQYKLTSLLIKQLKDIGFGSESEDTILADDCKLGEHNILLFGHECTSITATDHAVTVYTSSFKEGKYVEKDFRCNFVVGTDGAGSTVRRLMGIGMNGEKNLQNLISIHFMSPDLGQYLLNERPGMLFFIFNTEAIGVIVAHDLKQGEFVLQIPFYPPQQKFEDFRAEMCERLIFKLVGRKLADVNVLDVKPWVMHAEVAEKFLASNHRIILAGDAAHRFPPAGGFGMNTGIQDVHNLAWKLASVLKGIAPRSILSTYETERRQIATYNTALSVENFKAAMAVPAALGLDSTIANSVHRTINDTLGSILPSDVQKTILDGIFSIGRLQLSESLLNDSNPIGSSRLSKLRQIFEEGKSLQLQFPSEDLGFRYTRGALIPDDENSCNAQELPTGRRKDYVPSATPGSRLPHVKIKLLSDLSSKDALSTLDLVSVETLEFLLIIAPMYESYKFARAAFKATEELKVPLKVCIMWDEKDFKENGRSEATLSPWKNFVDAIQIMSSRTSKSWWDLCQMTNRGALLVRPDEHIAWRSKTEVENDPYLVAKGVFCSVLGIGSN